MKAVDMTIWTSGAFNVEDDEIWFVPYEYNLLCKYNIKTKKVEEILTLDFSTVQVESFNNIYRYHKQIFLIPAFEKFLLIYDIEKKSFDRIDFFGNTNVISMFNQCFQYGEWLYLFPTNYDAFARINMNTYVLQEFPIKDNKCKMFYSFAYMNDKVYLVNMSDLLYVFDLKTNQLEVEYKSNEIQALRTVTVVNDSLYITGKDGKVLLYDTLKKKGRKDGEYGIEFKSVHYEDSRLILVPLVEKEYFIEVNIDNGRNRRINFSNKMNYKRWPHSSCSKGTVYKNKLFFFNTQFRTMVEYDIASGELIENSLYLNEESVSQEKMISMFLNQIRNRGNIREGVGTYATLENYLEFCTMENIERR